MLSIPGYYLKGHSYTRKWFLGAFFFFFDGEAKKHVQEIFVRRLYVHCLNILRDYNLVSIQRLNSISDSKDYLCHLVISDWVIETYCMFKCQHHPREVLNHLSKLGSPIDKSGLPQARAWMGPPRRRGMSSVSQEEWQPLSFVAFSCQGCPEEWAELELCSGR